MRDIRCRRSGGRKFAAVVSMGVTLILAVGVSPAFGLLSPAHGSVAALPGPLVTEASGASALFGPGPCEGAGCPGVFPPVNNSTRGGTDEAVNVYAGGGISVSGAAAEMEGKIVTPGSFSLTKSIAGVYNVGIAGWGSRVTPPEGSDFLTIGGDLDVAGGSTLLGDFGVIRHAGVKTGAGQITGNVVQDPDAVASYAGANSELLQQSLCVATQQPTGTVKVDGGGNVTFVGDGTSATQVFTSDQSIGVPGNSVMIGFRGIPDGATIIINMTGSDPKVVSYSGDVNDVEEWNQYRERLLWNFPNATTIGFHGRMQFQGSVLIGQPGSATTVAIPGLAGRFFTAGSLSHTSDAYGGVGGEFHSYPFNGTMPRCDTGLPPVPPPVESEITVSKQWIVNGESLANGEQPANLTAGLTLNEAEQEWGVPRTGLRPNDIITIGETGTDQLPDRCALDSSRITQKDGETVDLPVPSDVTLQEGDNDYRVTNTVTCKPLLTLKKQVEGGDRPAADWTLIATPGENNAAGDADLRVPGSETGGTVEVTPGITYILTEAGPTDDYELRSLRCNVGEGGAYVDRTEVTLGPQDHVICVYVNGHFDIAIPPILLKDSDARLTLIKKVDNGTSKTIRVPTDWTLHAVGSADNISGVTDSDAVTEADVPAGTYALSETGPEGYRASDWSCVGATASTATSVTVTKGDHAVCTVTNTALKRTEPPTPPTPTTPPMSQPTPPPTSRPFTPSPPVVTDPPRTETMPPASRSGTSRPKNRTLARTGADVGVLVVIGLVLAGAGATLVIRRRSSLHDVSTSQREPLEE